MGTRTHFFYPISGDFCAKITFFRSISFVPNKKLGRRLSNKKENWNIYDINTSPPHPKKRINKPTSTSPTPPPLTTRSHSVQSLSLFKLIQEDGLHKCQIQARKFKICVARCFNLNPSLYSCIKY